MRKEIIIITWGGIGDTLLCTPAFKAVKEKHQDNKLIVYYHDTNKAHKQVLLNNPYIDSIRRLEIGGMWWRYPRHLYYYLFRRSGLQYYYMYFQHIPPSWVYQKNNKEIIADIFDVQLHDDTVQLFFTRQEEEKARQTLAPYKETILIHVYSRASVNHAWPVENWEALIRELPGYTFIQIGNENEPAIKGALDWRGKVPLRDAFCLLKYATSFVGIESCFAHATNAFGLPGVVLFGDTSPMYWGHNNNINIHKSLPCSPCFHYLWGKACPYNNECMTGITVGEVKEALIKQVTSRKSVLC